QGTTRDWADWDDTYNFIKDDNAAYIKSNLEGDSALTSNRLNLMVFVSPAGRIVFAKAYDLVQGKSASVPQGLLSRLSPGSPLLFGPNAGSDSGIKGLLSIPEGPILVALEPILTSDAKGPARGTLGFGRYLATGSIQHFLKTA